MIKHQKHAKLERPAGGQFHRNEFGFIGAPCSLIQSLCVDINSKLSDRFSFGFVDADHQESDVLQDSYDSIFTDKISCNRFDAKYIHDSDRYQLLSGHDAVLINGNHFSSDRQIVIIHASKKDSLFRKIDRLSNIKMIIMAEGMNQPYEFVTEKINGNEIVPVFSITNLDAICAFIEDEILLETPPLDGLIFMGGKSSRMGQDKSKITYRDQAHYAYLAGLLTPHCDQVSLSMSDGSETDEKFNVTPDTFTGLGPYGGLLSAFQKNPNHAIFSLPCDVPFIDEKLLTCLIENRNPSKIATCFHNPETNFPEPLITIWEPRAYGVLLQYLSRGFSCPRKVLINSDIQELHLDNPEKLFNANTAEERDWAMEKLMEMASS